MTFLGESDWQGRIFSGGWITGAGESYDSTEPASGKALGRVGAALPADLDRAVARAHRAQREWGALPYVERAQVLRRAARAFEEHHDEIAELIVRESGAVRPFADFQTSNGAAEECYEAAALAAVPYGEVLRSVAERLSFSRRRPISELIGRFLVSLAGATASETGATATLGDAEGADGGTMVGPALQALRSNTIEATRTARMAHMLPDRGHVVCPRIGYTASTFRCL